MRPAQRLTSSRVSRPFSATCAVPVLGPLVIHGGTLFLIGSRFFEHRIVNACDLVSRRHDRDFRPGLGPHPAVERAEGAVAPTDGLGRQPKGLAGPSSTVGGGGVQNLAP